MKCEYCISAHCHAPFLLDFLSAFHYLAYFALLRRQPQRARQLSGYFLVTAVYSENPSFCCKQQYQVIININIVYRKRDLHWVLNLLKVCALSGISDRALSCSSRDSAMCAWLSIRYSRYRTACEISSCVWVCDKQQQEYTYQGDRIYYWCGILKKQLCKQYII